MLLVLGTCLENKFTSFDVTYDVQTQTGVNRACVVLNEYSKYHEVEILGKIILPPIGYLDAWNFDNIY